jgi:hypothetical protein
MKWKLVGFMMALMLSGIASVSGVPFGIPISDRVVEGEITFPQQPEVAPVRFSLREGTLLTLADESTGRTDGWALVFDSAGQPTFRPFQLLNEDTIRQTGKVFTVPLGKAALSAGYEISASRVVIGYFPDLSIINPRGLDPEKLRTIYGKTGGGTCCVSCGSLTMCAGSVDMDCGSCSVVHGGRAV